MPPAIKHPKVAELMAQLYFGEPAAQTALMEIGFPPHLVPKWQDARSFWTDIVFRLDQGLGVEDGIVALLAATAKTYPGNKTVQELYSQWAGQDSMVATPPREISVNVPTPTLMLMGADLPGEFLAAIREQIGSTAADLLYVSKEQCAVAIPDPGDDAGQLQHQIQQVMQALAPNAKIQVLYDKHEFRPYLLSALTVYGPDTTPYLAESVPATTLAGDIAAALVQQIPGMADGRGGTVSTVIDAETAEGSMRLDPDKTLHENNVKDNQKLRVGTKAIAGSVDPEMRMQAQLRTRAQIRRYAYSHKETFAITAQDDESLPNRLTFTLQGPGLAPPENLDEFLAGTHNMTREDYRALPWEQLSPVKIDSHRFTLHLPPMFPVVAPIAVWNTPVFHPNIWRLPQPGVQPGLVCLGPLMDGYRPDLDFGYLCQLLVDIGTYRNYDVVDAPTYPDPPAALWARTESGQQVIKSIGGPAMRAEDDARATDRVRPALWMTTLASRLTGQEPGDQPQ
jgi:Effector-associated domain 1